MGGFRTRGGHRGQEDPAGGHCQKRCSNGAISRVQVIPVTSNTSKLYLFESRIDVKGARGKSMADQIMTADKQRLRKRIGKASQAEMLGIERAIRVQLGIR